MQQKQFLGEVELEILNIVWERREATVQEVWDTILKRRKTAHSSVLTMMRNLTKKGFLQYRQEGRTYIYSAAINPATVKSNLLQDTIQKVFRGSPVELVQNLVKDEVLTDEEIREIKNLIKGL